MLVGWRWTISKRVAVQGKMSRDDTSKNLFGVADSTPAWKREARVRIP